MKTAEEMKEIAEKRRVAIVAEQVQAKLTKISNEFRDIEEAIVCAAREGNNFIYRHLGFLCPENKSELVRLGYNVVEAGCSYKISWE